LDTVETASRCNRPALAPECSFYGPSLNLRRIVGARLSVFISIFGLGYGAQIRWYLREHWISQDASGIHPG
jgi:hypothetical protein